MLTKGVSQRSSLQLARPLEPGEEAGCRRADGLAAQLGELAQQPLLLVVELVRGLYRELDQVVVAPGEDLVGDHVELDVEVAGRAAELAGVAAALVADAHPVVEAGWDVDGQLGVLRDPALALAARARRQHLVAAAAAGHAGAGGDELAEQGLAHGALLAGAVAGPAGGRGRARLGPLAAAVLARGHGAHADVLGAAEDRLGELQVDPHGQVVAAAGARAGARAGGERVAAEEGVDHVGERSEAERVGRHLLAVEPGLPEGVVALPLLRVAEHAVGLGDLLEALLSVRVAGVEVRVVLARQLAVGALDLLGRGIAADAEHGVVVGHPALLDSSSGAGTPSSLLDRDVVARPGPPPQDAYLQIIEQVT